MKLVGRILTELAHVRSREQAGLPYKYARIATFSTRTELLRSNYIEIRDGCVYITDKGRAALTAARLRGEL